VLCFGADGHVKLESAFHERCVGPVHCGGSQTSPVSGESDHEEGEHCGPCADIPIPICMAKTSPVSKQPSPRLPIPATNLIAATNKQGCSANAWASSTSVDTSYFSPLRTVILLV
jgi:hypothetical protein